MARFNVVVIIFIATALMAGYTRHAAKVNAVHSDLVPLSTTATATATTTTTTTTIKSSDVAMSNRVAFWSALASPDAGLVEAEASTDNQTSLLLEQLLEHVYRQVSDQQEAVLEPCESPCLNTLEQFRLNQTFTDDELAEALGHIDELVALLTGAPQLQQEFIDIARNSSGNIREAILSAFAQLEPAAQRSLGRALVDTSDGRQRLDGVQLLARTDVMNESVAKELEELYPTEENEYVRTAMVKAFNQPELLRDKESAMAFLTHVMDTDSAVAVRGEALMASVELTDDAEFAVTRSLEAIRTPTDDYPQFGARALSAFLERHTLNGRELDGHYAQEMEYLMSEIMSPDFDHLPPDTRQQIDALYDRFF